MATSPLYDEAEVLRMLGHDSERRQAFELVVRHYSEQLYWTIRRFVLTHEDADDVLQNTFVKAWQNLPAFERRSSLSTWLHRIAVNEAIDHLRRNKNRIAAEQVEPLAQRLLADDYFDGDQAEALLQQAIASLPDVQRTVFLMRYYDNLPYTDISSILGTSVGALKASYHIATRKIKDFLQCLPVMFLASLLYIPRMITKKVQCMK